MKLKKLEVKAIGGINPNSPVIIDFTQSKFVTLEADQEQGKTTLLNALLLATGSLGAPDAKINKELINRDSGKIDVDFSFVGNDKNSYEVRCTKSSFSLTTEGVKVDEPLTQMKKLLGVVGISPMEIKKKPLKDIVKWISDYSNKSAEEFEAQMDKYKKAIKVARDARADANRGYKGLNEFLINEDMFNDWEESEKKYTKAVDVKALSDKLDVAGKASDKVIRAEEKLKQYKGTKENIEADIERLLAELTEKRDTLAEVEKNITAGEKFIEENKSVKKDYDTIKKQYDNAAAESVAYNKWQEIKRKKKERDEFETLAQKADAKEKQLLQEVKDLQAEILPDIKGVELVTEDTHENGEIKKEGLYVNGKSVAQLSESEWWSVVLLIWRKYKVRIIVIDNYQSLGSGAAEILEKLAKDGAYVLAAEMNREQKTLEIKY